MRTLSAKQREIHVREGLLLTVARKMFLKGGYHGMTMARIAEAMDYSKGTIYQHFACKEEILIALACQSVDTQRSLVERAAAFKGRSRERMIAIGVATEIFAVLHRGDARIFQAINAEAITQKATDEAIWRLRRSAQRTVEIILGVVRDGIAHGDLDLGESITPEELTFHLWLLGEGGKMASTSWMAPIEMGINDPFGSILRAGQALGDGVGWCPLSSEWDYEATVARIRREVFPDEFHQVQAS
jgi:AcrR family transcriptional regulator